MERYKKYVYAGIPVLGVLFYLIYLHTAAIDMVYSDYIRLVDSYLPDVWNPAKFFVPDLLTRIPINFLERGINVQFFGYSVTFDRVMGVLGFGLSAAVIAAYSLRKKVDFGWFLAIMTVMFSLNKWEMLYNGTGWAHFLAFACFYYNYLVLDRVYAGREKAGDKLLLFVLPAVITIGIAGPYCAIYSVTLILAYLFAFARKRMGAGQTAGLIACVVLPLLLYLWSNAQAVYEYSGAVSDPLLQTLFKEPKFFLTFFLKSFSSMVFGVELINRHMQGIPDTVWCLLGFLVLASYFLALWMNFYYGIAKKTIFPLMLLAAGGMNHVLVLVSRWIFIPNDSYGMSSRYALQFQVGILGILLTFALVARRQKTRAKAQEPDGGSGKSSAGAKISILMIVVAAVFLLGNLVTTAEEFSFAKHRKNHNLEVKEILLNFENETDEVLNAALEYHKDGTRRALTILKENGWNIYKGTNDWEVK